MAFILGDLITLFEHVFLPAHIIDCVERKAPISEVLIFLVPIASAVLLKVALTHIVGNYITPKSNAKINKYMKEGKKVSEEGMTFLGSITGKNTLQSMMIQSITMIMFGQWNIHPGISTKR